MVGRRNSRLFEFIAIDVNTQHDYCAAGGACPLANLSEVLPALRRTVAWVRRFGVPVVSSVQAHRQTELSDSGFPVHCLDGSGGQRKVPFTQLPRRVHIEIDSTLSLPGDVFRQYQQAVFRKRGDDLLLNPKADRLISSLNVGEFVLFGAGIESSIKALSLALLARGRKVRLLLDACGYWDSDAAELTIRQLSAKGVTIGATADLVRLKPETKNRYRRVAEGTASRESRTRRGTDSRTRPVDASGQSAKTT